MARSTFLRHIRHHQQPRHPGRHIFGRPQARCITCLRELCRWCFQGADISIDTARKGRRDRLRIRRVTTPFRIPIAAIPDQSCQPISRNGRRTQYFAQCPVPVRRQESSWKSLSRAVIQPWAKKRIILVLRVDMRDSPAVNDDVYRLMQSARLHRE